MDVLDFNREEPLCCKNYGTWNQCFHCLKGGEVWGDSQVGWITALSDTVGIAMARQPCLLIVCFIFSAFQKKNAFHKEHWLRAYPCSSGLYLILQQGTIWGPSNAWEIPHNCWYQHEIMFANHQCSVSTYILRNWSMTQMNEWPCHPESCIRRKHSKQALHTPVADMTLRSRGVRLNMRWRGLCFICSGTTPEITGYPVLS